MGEGAYVLGIKIYTDRSRSLLALSQSTYLDKVFKRFKMENSKKGVLPVVKGTSLSVTQSPATEKEKSEMSDIPYSLAIDSIMFAVQRTRLDVTLALSFFLKGKRWGRPPQRVFLINNKNPNSHPR
jgi:hypothetical protein